MWIFSMCSSPFRDIQCVHNMPQYFAYSTQYIIYMFHISVKETRTMFGCRHRYVLYEICLITLHLMKKLLVILLSIEHTWGKHCWINSNIEWSDISHTKHVYVCTQTKNISRCLGTDCTVHKHKATTNPTHCYNFWTWICVAYTKSLTSI